jgi:hypothetical protein
VSALGITGPRRLGLALLLAALFAWPFVFADKPSAWIPPASEAAQDEYYLRGEMTCPTPPAVADLQREVARLKAELLARRALCRCAADRGMPRR